MKRIAFLLSLGAALAAFYPAAAGAARFGGIIVAKQSNRHTFVVVSRTGGARTVRTARALRIGSRVVVIARQLRDGTYSATRIVRHGRAHHARIRAVVVRAVRGGKLVSAGHSVFMIHTPIQTSTLRDDHGTRPGDVVDEDVTIEPNGELDQDNEQEVGEANVIELEGSFVSFAGATLTIKTEGGPTIGVAVPANFSLPNFAPGQRLELKVSVSGSTFTLVKVETEDEDEGGDDDGGGRHDHH